MHTHSTQRVTITKFSTCTFKRKITDLDPSETQSPDASRRDKVQIPKPCFLLYFLPFHWIFLLNRVPFRHLLYESATFSFRGNPKEIYLVSKIFLILTKVLHTLALSLQLIEQERLATMARTHDRIAALIATVPPPSSPTIPLCILMSVLVLYSYFAFASKCSCECTCGV